MSDDRSSFDRTEIYNDITVDEGKMQPVTCPNCGNVHDQWTYLRDSDEANKPEPGSYIICSNCGSLNQLTKEWNLNEADFSELAMLMASRNESAIQIFQVLYGFARCKSAARQLKQLQEKCGRYFEDGDAGFVRMLREEYGMRIPELPPGSNICVLDEYELRVIHRHMVNTGLDQVGILSREEIEKILKMKPK